MMDKELLCAETGKVIHSHESKARAHLKHLRELNDYSGDVYPCVYCKGWHVGRAKKKAKKNKYRHVSI